MLGRAPLSEGEVFSPAAIQLSVVAEDVKLAAGRCATCLSTSGERKSCHNCGFVRYCNRDCQTAGWPVHKLVCKLLATLKEVATKAALVEGAPLLPLAAIWERLRGDGRAEAYEAAFHLCFWITRCSLKSGSTPAAGPGCALREEMLASGGVASLVSGLAAGGLMASSASRALEALASDHPEIGIAIVAAGALPLLVANIALPARHAELLEVFGFLLAADDAACLLRPWACRIWGSKLGQTSWTRGGSPPSSLILLGSCGTTFSRRRTGSFRPAHSPTCVPEGFSLSSGSSLPMARNATPRPRGSASKPGLCVPSSPRWAPTTS